MCCPAVGYCHGTRRYTFKITPREGLNLASNERADFNNQPFKDHVIVQGDSFGTRPKKMRISQRRLVRF